MDGQEQRAKQARWEAHRLVRRQIVGYTNDQLQALMGRTDRTSVEHEVAKELLTQRGGGMESVTT